MADRPFDPQELQPLFAGLVLGAGIMALLVVLGLLIGLPASITFGCPHQ
jgi:hypothetical protein